MLFIFLSFIYSTVDTNNFRKCHDMRFCRENQKISKKWSIDSKSVQIKDNIFTANLLLDGSLNDLVISIYELKTGGIRFRMTPTKEESFQRYDLSKNNYVINQNALNSLSSVKDSSSTDSEFTINFETLSVVIEYSTLKITIKQNDKIVTIINGRNQLVFEHHTNKEVPPEIYNGFTDNIKNGETAVGADFFFPGVVKFTGLSERATPYDLADTESAEETDTNSDNDEDNDNENSNEPLRLFNTDSFEFEADSPHNLYSSIPFCHAHSQSLSAALFWINPSDTFVSIRTISNSNTNGRELKFVSESGYVDFILFYGTNTDYINTGFKQIMKQYCEVTGYPLYSPLFAFGYHQSRWSYSTQHEAGVVMRGLDEIDIPFDSIWLDVDHLSGKTPFTMSHQGFPNPSSLISNLANDDRYLIRLCDPHFPHTNDYKQYRESHKSGYLVQSESGDSPFVGDCWPGPCSWPDFLNPSAFRWYSQQYSFESEGDKSGPNVFYWNDMNEPSIFKSDESTFPKALIHYGGYEDREVHNIYGLLNTAATYQGVLNRNPDLGRRPFILTRSYFSGSQKFAWTWTGDNTASWEHLAVSLPMVLTSCCCGMPFTGADLGGFLRSPDGNLLIRWFQLGAWLYPFFREHCHHKSARREPFMYDDLEQLYLKEAVITRYKLLPVWYAASRRANLTGVPPVLPVWAVFNSIEKAGLETTDPHEIEGSAVLAESFYVVPVVEDDVDEVEVLKLPGVWYHFETGKKVENKAETVKVTIKDTPVYLRGGKIVPTFSNVSKSALSTLRTCHLTLFVALDEKGTADGELYFDDGESYNYLKGEFVFRKFVCKNGRLESVKEDAEKQSSVPDVVKSSLINRIVVYGASGTVESEHGEASFENGVLTIQNLSFNINEDWSIKIQ